MSGCPDNGCLPDEMDVERVVSFRFEERISFTFFIIGLIFCLKQC